MPRLNLNLCIYYNRFFVVTGPIVASLPHSRTPDLSCSGHVGPNSAIFINEVGEEDFR